MRVGQMKILTSKTLRMKKKKIRYFADTPFCQIRAELLPADFDQEAIRHEDHF